MTSNSSWVPDESLQTLFAERSWLQGNILSATTYGIVFCLSFISLYELFRSSNRPKFKEHLPLLVYIAVSLLLNTFFWVPGAAFTQMAFIDDRNFPGGPDAFENNMFSIPIAALGNVCFVLISWWSDVLVLWRFKVIYHGSRVPTWLVILLPCLMFACSIALGIGFMVQVSTMNPFATSGINFIPLYLSVSLALNILLTIVIVLRLFSLRRHINALEPTFGEQYASIAAITVESAALYSVIALVFLALFWVENAVSNVFLESSAQFQTIATLLIVLRLVRNKAWTEETVARVLSARGLGKEGKAGSATGVATGTLVPPENA